MSSFQWVCRRSGLVLGLLFAGSAFPAAAQADAALDLVRSVAAESLPARAALTGKARKRRALVDQRRRPVRVARAAILPRPRLTAEQRGSGRVDVLEISDQPDRTSRLPAVERKGAAGLAPGLLATRPR